MTSTVSKKLRSIELFAGAGGMAIGFENAGYEHVLLNEIDRNACATLRLNRPHWNVINDDISNIDFRQWRGAIDVVAGGFPCQAFSYAGKRLGFGDPRGTLFFQYARAIRDVRPAVAMAENVKGLLTHDDGNTLSTILQIMDRLGYVQLACNLVNAADYGVPQKRERIILIWARADIADIGLPFVFPEADKRRLTLKDALCEGELYPTDVPASEGTSYAKSKKEVLSLVPPGGCWRDLPEEVAKTYMKGSWGLGGGKTGIARRISWDEPSLTILTSPSQMQTDRCHPDETRPFTIRESARIQTFPDDWIFSGSIGSQYKQIGNAVPVKLATRVAHAIAQWLEEIEKFSDDIICGNFDYKTSSLRNAS